MPQASYRETFRASTKHVDSSNVSLVVKVNSVMYGLNLLQTKKVKDLEFENAIVGGVVPREFYPSGLKKVW